MTINFTLPDIGEGLHEAEVVNWLVAVGDTVEHNQPFVEILTDKSQVEMPAPAAGTVTRLGAAEGDIIQVGEVLIVIDNGETSSDDVAQSSASLATDSKEPTVAAATDNEFDDVLEGSSPRPIPGSGGLTITDEPEVVAAVPAAAVRRAKASPATRKLASELDVDLDTVIGTGPGGRILADDIHAVSSAREGGGDTPAVASFGAALGLDETSHDTNDQGAGIDVPFAAAAAGVAVAAAAPSRTARVTDSLLGQADFGEQPLRGIRRATAKAMDHSWSTIPHVSAMNEVDATALLAARAALKDAAGGAPVTPLSLMLMAVARALRTYPLMNATLDLDGETITVHEQVNIGVAVASERGLMVPVIHDADTLGVAGMAAEVARLSTEARSGSVAPADLADGTFTVTNYGSHGGYWAAPIIRPGEAGIVGFGGIASRPAVVETANGSTVEPRPMLPVVISADHRLVDGDLLSVFHALVMDLVAEPVTMLL